MNTATARPPASGAHRLLSTARTVSLGAVLLWLSACGAALQPLPTTEAEIKPLSREQVLEVAAELERRGDVVRAEQYYRLALTRGAPESAVVPRLLSLYVNARQFRMAILTAEEFLRRHPEHAQTQLLLSALYEAVGDHRRAIDLYRSLIRRMPDNADAHFALAIALRTEGLEPVSADRHFRRYLELNPDGPYAEQAQASLLTEVQP